MHGIQLISINAVLISLLPTLSPISFWQSFPLYTLKNIAFHMESGSKINVDLFFFFPFNIMASRPRLILPYGLYPYKTEDEKNRHFCCPQYTSQMLAYLEYFYNEFSGQNTSLYSSFGMCHLFHQFCILRYLPEEQH